MFRHKYAVTSEKPYRHTRLCSVLLYQAAALKERTLRIEDGQVDAMDCVDCLNVSLYFTTPKENS
jgi:hypothetical protein